MREDIQNRINTSPEDQVDLGEMNIVDEDMEEIADAIVTKKPDAREIFLNNNNITDKSANLMKNAFSKLSQLLVLDLQFNALAKPGITILYSLKSVHPDLDISLHGNQITDTNEMKAIEEAAPKFLPK